MPDDQLLNKTFGQIESFIQKTGSNPETGELGEAAQGARERLEAEHFEAKLNQANRTEDLTRSQMTLLGKCLEGTRDNTERWQKVRRGFAARGGEFLPLHIWSPEFREMVSEIDAVYLGHRETRRINGSSVSQSYRQRVDAGVYNGAVGVFQQLVQELTKWGKRQNEVDFDASVEFARSAIVKRMLDDKREESSRLQRGGKPPEALIAFERERMMEIDALMQGRCVDDMVLDDISDLSSLKERMTEQAFEPIPTGMYGVDIAIGGGVVPGRGHRVFIIAADSGVGKTQMCVILAMGLVLNKADVLFISVEMTADEMKACLLANFSYRMGCPVPNWMMEKGRRDRRLPDNFGKLEETWQNMRRDKERGDIWLKYELDMGCSEIEQTVQAAKDLNPNLAAVFIDHFQDMRPQDPRAKKVDDVHLRARELARIAKRYRVDIFLAAQLNREAAHVEFPGQEHIADGYTLTRVAHALWTVAWFRDKEQNNKKDLTRRWLINAKKRKAGRKADGTTESGEKHELFGDLDYSYLHHVQTVDV